MEGEQKEAWKLLLESLDNQRNEIVRLQEREIELLNSIMRFDKIIRDLIKVFSEDTFKNKTSEFVSQSVEGKQ